MDHMQASLSVILLAALLHMAGKPAIGPNVKNAVTVFPYDH